MLSFEQCFILFCKILLFALVVGGLGFEFCVFVAGWRHALRSEWPFIIIIIIVGTLARTPTGTPFMPRILFLTAFLGGPSTVTGEGGRSSNGPGLTIKATLALQ